MTAAGDRRPVAARGWRPIVRIAEALIARQASPDAISVAGMLAACAAAAAILLAPGVPALWLAAAILVQLRLLANVLDGMVAVGRGVASPLGELFNEVPDRVSDVAVLAALGYPAHDPGLGWAAATLAVATAYVRAAARAAGAPSDFRGPMAKQQRMALATALALACAVLPADWVPRAGQGVLWIVALGSAVTALRRLTAAARHLRR